ncbi:MAG: universal stress protein [Labilithrix sp.]|nr:universal stress protein [Labilithrix sp.]
MRPRAAVVVGTDLSAGAARAVARSATIARERSATLHVVHATSRLPRALARQLDTDEAATARKALDVMVADLRAGGTAAVAHTVAGGAAPVLRKRAREVDARVIVVGSRGRTLSDALIGSTAERVVDVGGAPVLLAREPSARRYRNVVVAIDEESDVRRAVDAATFVGNGAELSLLHAYECPFESRLHLHGAGHSVLRDYREQCRAVALEELTPRVAAAGLSPSALQLTRGNRHRVLAHAAKSRTLLVIIRKSSAARRLLLGSMSRWVIEHTTTDVLLV